MRRDERSGRSTLGTPLPGLIAASDPAAFAQQRGLAYRDETVQVIISVTAAGRLEELDADIASITTEQGTELIAWVPVSNLGTLAARDAVRSVQPVTDAQPHGRPD